MGELIAVLSGKGGTGKTSVCAGISTALAQNGSSVLCIDCDIGLRNLDIALGLSEFACLSFVDVCSGGHHLGMAVKHPLFPTLSFLTAPMNALAEDIDLLAFSAMLEDARKQFDYVLMDAPAGLDAGFRLSAKYADRVILVTGPDPASIRDAGRAGEVLELMGKENVRLIVNRLSKKAVKTVRLTVDDIMDKAGLPLLGIVPEDPDMLLAVCYRLPLLAHTRKGAAKACHRIAKRIAGLSVPISL